MSPKPQNHRLKGGIFSIAISLVALSSGFTILQNGDLWWHLATGKLILKQGLATRDPWSYSHTGAPWLQHEWLSDVIYVLWSKPWGIYYLVYWKWFLIMATFLVLFYAVSRYCEGDYPAAYLSTTGACLTAAPFLDFRPHLYTFLLTAVLIYCANHKPMPIKWLPPIFLVWGNLHSGVIFGLLLICIVLITSDQRFLKKLSLGISCLVASLLNPSGIHILQYPLKYAFHPTSPYRTLREWLPPFSADSLPAPLYPWALGVVSICLILLTTKRCRAILEHPPTITNLTFLLLTTAMSLKSCRFIPLFSLCAAPIVGMVISTYGKNLWRGKSWPSIACLLWAIISLYQHPLRPYAFHYLAVEDNFPWDTVNYLQANQWHGNIFNYYSWGGFLEYRLNNQVKVFIDGRADTVYPDSTFRVYLAILNQEPNWIERLEHTGADAILWPENLPHIRSLLATRRWKVVYHDAVSILLFKKSLPTPAVSSPDTAYRHITLTLYYIHRHNLEQAWEQVNQALTRKPFLRSAHLMRIFIARNLKQPDLEAKAITQARSWWPLGDLYPPKSSPI